LCCKDDGVAPRQFLIIVTEHRSVIKDWSGSALWNGSPFDSAVLGDGDIVDIADIQLSFRMAKSLGLISQLPYVAEPGCTDPISAEIELGQYETQNTEYVTADGMLAFEESGDRLDELIFRIESSLAAESSSPASDEAVRTSQQCHAPTGELDFESDAHSSITVDEVESRMDAAESTLESMAGIIDDELLQLEKLRTAVQLEREQLLAKRALLVQQTWEAESQLQDVRTENESAAVDDLQLSGGLNDGGASGIPTLDDSVTSDSEGEAVFCESEFIFAQEVANDFVGQLEDEAVTAEREKLCHYVEEFDSANDAKSDDAANVKVAVVSFPDRNVPMYWSLKGGRNGDIGYERERASAVGVVLSRA
jgi:hypothetical protein